MTANLEFSRPVQLRHVDARLHRLEANEAERAALAARFGLVSIGRLDAAVELERKGEAVDATGTLEADIVQSCAISGEDLPKGFVLGDECELRDPVDSGAIVKCRRQELDSDEVREHLSKGLGFSRADRDTNIRRIGYVARLLSRNGVDVISAAISPYRDVRDELRAQIPGFVEVYVKASLDTCVARDVKGLYRRALAGEIPNFTGVSDPYEEPLAPHLVIDTERETVAESTARVVQYLAERFPLAFPLAEPARE